MCHYVCFTNMVSVMATQLGWGSQLVSFLCTLHSYTYTCTIAIHCCMAWPWPDLEPNPWGEALGKKGVCLFSSANILKGTRDSLDWPL